MRRNRNILYLAIVLAFLSYGASCPNHIQTVALYSADISATAVEVQKIEIDLHNGGFISEESHRKWQQGFLDLGTGIKLLNQAAREANDKKVLEQVSALLGLVKGLVDNEIPKLPEKYRVVVSISLTSIKSTLLVISSQWG